MMGGERRVAGGEIAAENGHRMQGAGAEEQAAGR